MEGSIIKTLLFRLTAFVAILGLITLIAPIQTQVSAVDDEEVASKCDTQFYSSNDILFYDPCANTCSASATGAATTITALRGKNNGEKIFNYWVDAGLTAQQAAGVTGSMKHEGGFSPFRQEMSKTWPAGGWGIAQFTFDPGQRGAAKAFVSNAVGVELFNQYYKNDFGGPVVESNGFVPAGVPIEVNDKFLLAELNYLQDHIKSLLPNSVRKDFYKRDFNITIGDNVNLYDYLKTVVQAADAATAWTYLYEFPGDIKNTALARATSAAEIMTLYSTGIASTCGGGLQAGGMTLEAAIAFMGKYTDKNNATENEKFIGNADRTCAGGPLSNCVSFSTFFINKYTNLAGFNDGRPSGNGSTLASNAIARNPTVQNSHSPRPYAIFSTPSGTEMCGDVKCGHTGVILGVDTTRGKVIVGEASCGGGQELDTAKEYDLAAFDSDAYTYVYTDGFLKGDVN
jgi:hypothetical protein